jgi:hypothetical protein
MSHGIATHGCDSSCEASFGDERAATVDQPGATSLGEVEAAIRQAWGRETYDDPDDWSESNRARGRCAVRRSFLCVCVAARARRLGGLRRFGLAAAVEPLFEVAAQLLTRRAKSVARAPRLEAHDAHLVVARPVATGVALRLRQRAHPHAPHSRTATGRRCAAYVFVLATSRASDAYRPWMPVIRAAAGAATNTSARSASDMLR